MKVVYTTIKMSRYECPKCGTENRIDMWDDGECTKCGNEYWWEEYCDEDYEDCWGELVWEKFV